MMINRRHVIMKKNSWIYEPIPEYGQESLSERLISKGTSCLSNKELISLSIGASSNRINDSKLDEILAQVESGKYSYESLKAIIGEDKALSLMATLELCKRTGCDDYEIKTPQDIYNLIRHYSYDKQEKFIVLVLDGAHKIIDKFVATTGLVNRAIIHPREVFSRAIELRATSIILAHNHPSGMLEPSKEDITTTTRLAESGEILGIKVIDHLIISQKSYFSFRESGLM